MSVPKHVTIVMDGNGRWASQQKQSRIAGHEKGAVATKNIVIHAAKSNIQVLSLFAFSSENWGRPKEEVSALMSLFLSTLQEQSSLLTEHNIRLSIIGDKSRFTQDLVEEVARCESLTETNTGMTLLLAVNYSGRWDITQAIKTISQQIETGKISANTVDESIVQQHLSFADLPEPDLFIRTSGEQRISNFMLWQLAYTELYFTQTLWPEFTPADFDTALEEFAQRSRRYGLVKSPSLEGVSEC